MTSPDELLGPSTLWALNNSLLTMASRLTVPGRAALAVASPHRSPLSSSGAFFGNLPMIFVDLRDDLPDELLGPSKLWALDDSQ